MYVGTEFSIQRLNIDNDEVRADYPEILGCLEDRDTGTYILYDLTCSQQTIFATKQDRYCMLGCYHFYQPFLYLAFS